MPNPENIRSARGYGWWFPAALPPDAQARRLEQEQTGSRSKEVR